MLGTDPNTDCHNAQITNTLTIAALKSFTSPLALLCLDDRLQHAELLKCRAQILSAEQHSWPHVTLTFIN